MTKRCLLTIAGSVLIFFLTLPLSGQPLSFRSLGTAEGMRTLTSWHCTFDGFGHLWVSTTDGLLRYDGNEVSYYFTSTHPELASDQTAFLYCDSKNRIWIPTYKGLTMADEDRILKRQILLPDEPDRPVNFCFEDSKGNIMAISEGRCFQQASPSAAWVAQPWLDTLITGGRIRDVRRFDSDRYLLVIPHQGVLLINLREKRQDSFFPLRGVKHAARLDDHSIALAQDGAFTLYKAFLGKPDSLLRISPPSFFAEGDVNTVIGHMTLATNGKLYITTDGAGLVEYDVASKTYYRYLHDAANPFSIAENALRYIISDSLGNIAFSSLSGVNYTNVRPREIEYMNFFKTNTGEVYDDRVISIAEDTLRQVWIVMEKAVLVMSADRQDIRKLTYPASSSLDESAIAVQYAAADDHGHIWIAFQKKGIGIFNTSGKLVRMLTASSFPFYKDRIERVRIMKRGLDGYMYVGAENGLFRINQEKFTIDTFPSDTALKPLRRSRVVDIMPLPDQLWVTTSPSGAAWHYHYETKELKKYTTSNGLVSNRAYGLAMDHKGLIYVGSYVGLNIIHPDGHVENLTKGEGLPSTRIDAIEKAPDGSIWMTNTYNLLKYNPEEKRIEKIVSHSGFSRVNYQIVSSTSLASGELVFGTHKGMVVVNTHKPEGNPDSFKIFVFSKIASGHEFLCTKDRSIHLTSNEKLIRFSFGINDLILADQMVYRYKLSSGKGGSWSEPSHLSRVDFNLDPGSYSLEVEASDGHAWYSASGPFQINIDYPWWRKWWVVMLAVIAASLSVWFYLRGRIEKYKKELSVARQISDLESKALRAQMNPHFVFNSLNAIQECIVTGKVDEAYTYLSQFSRLLRLVLEHSDRAEVSLQEELEVLSLFVSLEKLRFRNDMHYTTHIAEDLDLEEIRIPPMLIQPHLENAIWHGLRHASGEKILRLTLEENEPGYLEVTIEDNGIGRVKAASLQLDRLGNHKHKSKGSRLSGNRMALLKTVFPLTTMEIEDRYDHAGIATGTKVHLRIPIMNTKTG
jgi:ligand-binding sensor domain-containing protein/anti-sigma regulatory factor (Ser/Thr protein kinase)